MFKKNKISLKFGRKTIFKSYYCLSSLPTILCFLIVFESFSILVDSCLGAVRSCTILRMGPINFALCQNPSVSLLL